MNQPEGWRDVVLGNACEINPRLVADEKPAADSPVSFVAMSAVDEILGMITAPETRLLSEVQRGYTPFRNGDVLFAKVTHCMENGKAAIARNLKNGIGFGSTEFHVLRPDPDLLLPEYLFYFIRQPSFRKLAAASFMGTGGLQRVPADFFRRIKLTLPPLPEQMRIVEAFDELEAIARARAGSAKSLAALVRREFLQIFGQPMSNPHGFPKARWVRWERSTGAFPNIVRGMPHIFTTAPTRSSRRATLHVRATGSRVFSGLIRRPAWRKVACGRQGHCVSRSQQTLARRQSLTSTHAFQTVWSASTPTRASPAHMSFTA